MQQTKQWHFGHIFLALMIFLSGVYLLQNRTQPVVGEVDEVPERVLPTPIPGQLYADTWDNSSFCPKAGTSAENVTVERADLPGLRYKVTGNGFEPFVVEFWLEYANQPDPDRVVIEITDIDDVAIDEIKDWLYPQWEDHYLYMTTQSGEVVFFYFPPGSYDIQYGVLVTGRSCE